MLDPRRPQVKAWRIAGHPALAGHNMEYESQ